MQQRPVWVLSSMLFSEQSSTFALGRQESSAQRHSLLAELLAAFQRTFPEIQYQIFPELNLLNGQALILGTRRIVRLYGGLALHPAIGRDGLAFALLHETGHHRSHGARLPWNRLIACECAADYWAFNLGRKIFSNSTGWTVNIPNALDEVNCILEVNKPEIILKAERDSNACWGKLWNDRKASIREERSPPADHRCRLYCEVLALSQDE
jgi:hypothetical protein